MLRSIKGFPGYRIDSDGNVYICPKKGFVRQDSFLLPKWRLKKTVKNKRGYLYVSLRKEGKLYNFRLARLMLSSFVGPCPKNMEACHNNGVKSDNRLLNLRWDSHRNNLEDRKKHGTWQEGETHPRATLTERQVYSLKKQAKDGVNMNFLALLFKTSRGTVENIKYGRTWKKVICPTYAI